MSTRLSLLFLVFTVMISGIMIGESYAEISPNDSFVIQGTGYLATEESIKASEIDILLTTGAQSGSRTNIDIENGVITINNDDYLITSSTATSLREGKYLRISATAESPDTGDEITLSTLGRLIQDSKQGSIYTFTGRIIASSIEYKIIYIGQLSDLGTIPIETSTNESTTETNGITVHIVNGASNSALTDSYIDKIHNRVAGYFSHERLTIDPGTVITFVNDDEVSHTLLSGTGLDGTRPSGELIVCTEEEEVIEGASYSQNNCDFTIDGRLNSGEIAPGESWTATFAEMGIYRLIDLEYPWMKIEAYVFPETDSELIRQGNNPLGN